MQILLSSQIAALQLPWSDALVVHHKRYPLPQGGATALPFDQFAADPRAYLRGCTRLVVVGLSRAMTPGNRTADVFEVLFNLSPQLPKVSLDTTLFIGEPWRSWFHFGLVGASYREYTYSYLAESHWRAYQDGARPEDPFSAGEIQRWGTGVIASCDARYFAELTEAIVPQPPDVHEAYRALKEECFGAEHTVSAILRRLAAFAQQVCPDRTMPNSTTIFNARTIRIVRTDLPVDAYLASVVRDRAALADGIAAAHQQVWP